MKEWTRVTPEHPCPICRKPDWCGVLDNLVCCMRIQSQHQTKNGGWIHKLDEPQQRPAPPPNDKALLPATTAIAPMIEAWQRTTSTTELRELSEQLGVTPESLDMLGAAWSFRHHAWAFPMTDIKVVGIRLRDKSGRKWAVTGSKQGLFIPRLPPPDDHLAMICEGPTDTAAALSLGFYAIGRPSCAGGEDMAKRNLRRLNIWRIIICADNDPAGRTGAARFAQETGLQYKIMSPLKKDLRAWLIAGATKELVMCIINQQLWKGKHG